MQYVINGRLAGPLQYANTNAVVLLLALMLVLDIKMKFIYKTLWIIAYTLPILLTMSRSTVVIAVAVLIVKCLLQKWKKETYLPLISSILICVIVLWLLDKGGALSRIASTNTNASEWQTRLLYYKDAIGMIKNRLFGYGPYGYYYVQRAFQTGSTYYVKFVHSSVIQIGLDLGVLGMTTFMAFGLYVVFIKKMQMSHRLISMVLLGHSLIDIDLAFAYIWLLLIVFLQDSHRRAVKINLKSHVAKRMCILFGVVLITMVSYFLIAQLHYITRDYDTAYEVYPGHTEAIRHQLGKNPGSSQEVALASILMDRQPYILKSYEVMYNHYALSKDYEGALMMSRRLVLLNPLNIKRYENLARILRVKGENQLLRNNVDLAIECFEEVIKMPETLEQLAKAKITHYNVKHVPALAMTNELRKDYLIANSWLDKIEEETWRQYE